MMKSLLSLKSKLNRDIIITTSWDDFTDTDELLVELLGKYQIPATFYIPYCQLKLKRKVQFARELLNRFDIGSHTINHKILTHVSEDELIEEVNGSKQLLEERLKTEITSFCYPRGRMNESVIQAVKDAGYTSARTVEVHSIDIKQNPYKVKTTLHAYSGRKEYKSQCWVEEGLIYLDKVFHGGGYFHLWGHSAEIEKNKEWVNLEWFFSYIRERINKL